MTNAVMDNQENIEKLKILLADDDPFMQRIIEKLLNDLGFENIVKADDGQQALDILQSEAIDLLLTDIQMPELNGLELMKKIRSGNTSSVPRNLCIIIITSFSNTETLGSSLALDVNGFLTKPFKPAEVMKTLFQALSEQDHELRSEDCYLDVNTDLHSMGVDDNIDDGAASETKEEQAPDDSRIVQLHQLQPNMRLTKDVKTNSGMLLMSTGFVLNQNTIKRLHELGDVVAEQEYHIELISQQKTA